MNVGELRAAFEGLVDDSVDNALFLIWLNEAQNEIAVEYGVKRITTISSDGESEYSLPSDFLKPLEVRDSSGARYDDYEITEWGEIKFFDEDTYIIHYLGIPSRIPANDDNATSELHELLHDPLYIYAAAMYYDMESTGDAEESAMATKLLRKFNSMVLSRTKALKARKRKNISMTTL